jgi:uncharacterized protein (TIGR02145 family)
MKYLLITTLLLSTAYSQCDANDDGVINVQDVVVNVNCILGECWTCDFDLTDVCVDIDGNEYKTIQIGNQLWMAENLKVTHYNNGDEIYFPYGNGVEWANMDNLWYGEGGQYAHYDNDPENAEIYGNLYSWFTAIDNRGICPEGFHVPTLDDFLILTENVGGYSAAGKMREIGFAHWDYPNISATNESCFTALPAGIIVPFNGWPFDRIGWQTEFWSSTQVGESLRIRYLLTDFHFINSLFRKC